MDINKDKLQNFAHKVFEDLSAEFGDELNIYNEDGFTEESKVRELAELFVRRFQSITDYYTS
jgi:hypothetical protein